MSEPMLISPLLDGYVMGEVMSEHQGVRCCPALLEGTDERYIVKIVSIPAAQTQLEALLLSGAYRDSDQAKAYFKELAAALEQENELLHRLSRLEGFVPYQGLQTVEMDQGIGYRVCLLSPYRDPLDQQMIHAPLTHLAAVNLGLDMCAALTVSRQAGYLYADLKPSNIFKTETRGYCIGDLGFIPLSSLKYASLPEKYRSSYTAPEISDAYAALNDRLDVYALGLVLYQVYNNGQLPFDGSAPHEPLPAPLYADYEMAQIILKACAPDPADRWADPAQMGQELVNYMQRNGVEDEPIIPPPVQIPDGSEDAEEEFLSEEENDAELAELLAMIPDEEPPAGAEEAAASEPAPDAEPADDTDTADALTEDGVTVEVAQMLAQADELIDHELPEPVVAPDPIDIPIPPPIVPEVEEDAEEAEPVLPIAEEEDTEDLALSDEDDEVAGLETLEEPEASDEGAIDEYYDAEPRSRISGRLIAVGAALLLLLGICFGIYFYYQHHYIQSIETLIIQGNYDEVTVLVFTDADEELLTVSCSDSYGNTLRSAVQDGKVTFSGLRPNYQYRIQVHISGRHKLTGSVSGSYTARYPEDYFQTIDELTLTPSDTQILVDVTSQADESLLTVTCTDDSGQTMELPIVDGQATFTGLTPNTHYTFTLQIKGEHELQGKTTAGCATAVQTEIQNVICLTGSQDGSVIIEISSIGPAPDVWTLVYTAEDGEGGTTSFAGSQAELYGLAVGTEYSFRLEAAGAYLTGPIQWTYSPQALILTESIEIVSCINGSLTLEWTSPDAAPDQIWTIRCFNDAGFDQTITATGSSAVITGLDHSVGYTVMITAEGMSRGNTVSVTADPITITGFTVENITDAAMDLVWSFEGTAPADGWVLTYTVNGGEEIRLDCTEARASLPSTADAVYSFHVAPATEITCINQSFQYTASAQPEATA